MWDEFKKFLQRGNVIDLAVGIVIGGAFSNIVSSLVDDVIMPPVGLLLGKVDFSALYINLSSGSYESLARAKEAGAATINYGLFISTIIDFLLIALVIFLLIRQINRLQEKGKKKKGEPTTKDCPYCFRTIPIKATRCPECTSDLS